ncbi:MAG: hypothetical protein VBE63_18775 [Lamprobacter sp.]|uniref:hypothetical protein n=1 Tax=Lamprobacter sp. TaxID=3100796 RepID=UPI002B263D4B|nr:hypothetical protein [Lamprobacter sp.]MEA3641962.1 hypothetical protein [Lamprobacter sp.]
METNRLLPGVSWMLKGCSFSGVIRPGGAVFPKDPSVRSDDDAVKVGHWLFSATAKVVRDTMNQILPKYPTMPDGYLLAPNAAASVSHFFFLPPFSLSITTEVCCESRSWISLAKRVFCIFGEVIHSRGSLFFFLFISCFFLVCKRPKTLIGTMVCRCLVLHFYGQVLHFYGYKPTVLWSFATEIWWHPQVIPLPATKIWSALLMLIFGFNLLQIYGYSRTVLILLQKYGPQAAATDLWYEDQTGVLLQKYGCQSAVPSRLHQLRPEAVSE